MERLWIGLGGLAGLLAVAMAALAAHGLQAIGPVRLEMARNALQMQGWHALALLTCGLWARRGGRLVDWAGVAFTAGQVLFCSGVYGLALGGLPLGMLAPVGGTLLMAGWVLLGVSAWYASPVLRERSPRSGG
jgi:uncharacterized membrane protein YgdD (TMEM256/DUF423 family)